MALLLKNDVVVYYIKEQYEPHNSTYHSLSGSRVFKSRQMNFYHFWMVT